MIAACRMRETGETRMLHLDGLSVRTPHLPSHGWKAGAARLSLSAALHLVVAMLVVGVFTHGRRLTSADDAQRRNPELKAIAHLVFIAREAPHISGGGGGGGNRQAGPIRHAEGIGRDAITLRTTSTLPSFRDNGVARPPAAPAVLLDARPLASGNSDVLGLPVGGVSFGTSTGPGSSGGVGEGTGTGIGSGSGPGLGPGSGGGTGGGAYKPGGAVSPPRVIREVKPTFTADALAHKVQGRVVLELVVNRAGRAENVRVVTPLDPGLDEQAIAAARQWRFEPGRLAGTPVDVVVTLALDFWIQ
jgi:protein TonB